MANAFGYVRMPQQPTPPAEAVGMALLQRGQQQQAAPTMGRPDYPEPGDTPDASPDAGLRAQGAHRMTGPGQMDDSLPLDDGHSINALNVAVGEALTRLGGGYQTNINNPFKDRTNHVRQLRQLGLSEVEAQLLVRSGGI